MTSQRSLLPKSMASAASASSSSSGRPKLDAKARSRIAIGFASLGAAAFLQNAGFVPGLAFGGGGGGGGGGVPAGASSSSSGGRSLTIEPHEIEVTRVDERTLQVAVNGLNEGYYAKFGDSGICVDSNNPPRPYDYARYREATLEACANRCAGNLLLSEHRGFNYDAAAKDCCCLYDDHLIPLVEQRRSSSQQGQGLGLGFNDGHDALGEISGTLTTMVEEGDMASYECYVKQASALGDPLESYEEDSVSCGTSDGKEYDIVEFNGGVTEPAKCAEKCLRFKLFASHMRIEHSYNQCDCLFVLGEAPQARKLAGSTATAFRGKKFEEREFGDIDQLKCYDKKNLGNAPVEDRVPVDSNQRVWINEFHYRNVGDNQPFIEVIGPKGVSAGDYVVVAYQGRNGAVHNTIPLTGTFASATSDGWGYVTVDVPGRDIRKGKQGGDGLALVRTTDNACLQLLSYTDVDGVDRSFQATQGACALKSSTPIGVFEDRSTPLGHSLQLVNVAGGGGNHPGAFTWSGPGPSSKGDKNVGQTLTSPS